MSRPTLRRSWEERVRSEAKELRALGLLEPDGYPPALTKGAPAPSWLDAEQRVKWEKARAQFWETQTRCPSFYADLLP